MASACSLTLSWVTSLRKASSSTFQEEEAEGVAPLTVLASPSPAQATNEKKKTTKACRSSTGIGGQQTPSSFPLSFPF